MIRVKWLDQTASIGCPSTWEGETDGGKFIYIRWRHDFLRAVVGKHDSTYHIDNEINILSDCDVIYYEATPKGLEVTTEVMERILEKYFIF